MIECIVENGEKINIDRVFVAAKGLKIINREITKKIVTIINFFIKDIIFENTKIFLSLKYSNIKKVQTKTKLTIQA